MSDTDDTKAQQQDGGDTLADAWLWDYYAGKVLGSLAIAGLDQSSGLGKAMAHQAGGEKLMMAAFTAAVAGDYADAMIAERKKRWP